MREKIINFFYFINNIHYLKELSKQNNHKSLIDQIKHKKKNFYFQLLLFTISGIIIYNTLSSTFKFKTKTYINYTILILSLLYYLIFNFVLSKFSRCYDYFIKLCEAIVLYDNTIKNKIKIRQFMQNIEEELNSNIMDIIKEINKIIKQNVFNSNDYKTKNTIEIFNSYQKLKSNLFKFIFEEYEKEYINKEIYVFHFINFILYYKNSLEFYLKYLTFEFKKNLSLLNREKVDYSSLIKEFEKYINNNVIKIEEIKKNELKNKIYGLLISNYKLNENYIDLIKEINSIDNDNNKDNDKIVEMIDIIIEKKHLSISLLEQFKKQINIQEDKNIQKENEKIKKNDIIFANDNKNNFYNNGISFYDINLNSFNINKSNFNKNKDNIETNISKKNVEAYDIIKEEENIKDLKASFIDELNNYCKKVKGLNKDKGKEEITNEERKKENNANNVNNLQKKNLIKDVNAKSEEDGINKPFTKLDFSKSLTLALSKNKNFNLNVFGDNNENDK